VEEVFRLHLESAMVPDMDQRHVLFTLDGRVGTITLNRPGKLNAFAGEMRQELAGVVGEATSDDRVRVVVITGAGRAFCAGADVAYLQDLITTGDWESARELVEVGAKVVSAIASLPKPVIAAVNGPAAGGGANLALACDVRIASDRASIGQTFNRIGLHPDWGGTYFLPRLVGPAKALELMFTGDMIEAQEGLRLGLFNRVVPHERLMEETRALAERLAEKPPIALALAKQAVRRSFDATLQVMLDVELDHQSRCFTSEDAREGISAFLEKRAPVFRGI
jgi:2-(1,2-epoxy-1,2-dihydrophenyl)acetyl-CoA isomerase